jgi:predicted phage gp36 major capsid-like protein
VSGCATATASTLAPTLPIRRAASRSRCTQPLDDPSRGRTKSTASQSSSSDAIGQLALRAEVRRRLHEPGAEEALCQNAIDGDARDQRVARGSTTQLREREAGSRRASGVAAAAAPPARRAGDPVRADRS